MYLHEETKPFRRPCNRNHFDRNHPETIARHVVSRKPNPEDMVTNAASHKTFWTTWWRLPFPKESSRKHREHVYLFWRITTPTRSENHNGLNSRWPHHPTDSVYGVLSWRSFRLLYSDLWVAEAAKINQSLTIQRIHTDVVAMRLARAWREHL